MTQAAPGQPAKPAGRLRVSAPVLWIGLALGTFLAVLALAHGVMLPWFGGFLDAVLTFVLLLLAGVVLTELTRRHHRAAFKHGWRYGKRGAGAAARGTARSAAQLPAAPPPGHARGAPGSPPPAGQVGRTRRTCRAGHGRPAREHDRRRLPGLRLAAPRRRHLPDLQGQPGTRPAGSGHRPHLLVGPRGQPVRLAGG